MDIEEPNRQTNKIFVRLGEVGWKEQYFYKKFNCKNIQEMEVAQRDVAH